MLSNNFDLKVFFQKILGRDKAEMIALANSEIEAVKSMPKDKLLVVSKLSGNDPEKYLKELEHFLNSLHYSGNTS